MPFLFFLIFYGICGGSGFSIVVIFNKSKVWAILSFESFPEFFGLCFSLISFIGVNFEAGNESGFCSYRCFLESEKLRCEKSSVSERNFLITCILKHFFNLFWLRGLFMIIF